MEINFHDSEFLSHKEHKGTIGYSISVIQLSFTLVHKAAVSSLRSNKVIISKGVCREATPLGPRVGIIDAKVPVTILVIQRLSMQGTLSL